MVTIYNNTENEFIPEASKSYSAGWRVIGTYFIELLVIGIVYSILSGPMSIIQFKDDGFEWYMIPLILFGMLYGIFVAGPIGYGANWVFLKAVRGERVEVKDIFAVFQRNYWNAVVANVVVMVIVGMGFIMLVVPGIIFACRLAFVPYLVVDKQMDVMEALKVSWNMTRGHAGHIFLMGVMAFFIGIGGLLLFIVGIFVSIMWIKASFAAMYYAVEQQDGIPEYNYPGE